MFLIELLETHPHYLGDQEGIGDLPFMFKVLSIDKALSIQVTSVVFFSFSVVLGTLFFFTHHADRLDARIAIFRK